ncbi:MAG: hypothetical protein K2Y29_01355 [Beijerinckiaceae bacterium]|nr:hypothetical protein [Beijerinckiaceae bacterium]
MSIAFLSALLDPMIVGTALVGVFLVKSAMQLRAIVAGVAMALSLSELIGGVHEPLLKILGSAAGAGLAGLLLAEAARMIVAPAAALLLGGALVAISWFRSRQAK